MRLLSANVSMPKEFQNGRKAVETGIFKSPLEGRVLLRKLNLGGDGQADLVNHGGPHRAAYAYPVENYAHWGHELGRAGPGLRGVLRGVLCPAGPGDGGRPGRGAVGLRGGAGRGACHHRGVGSPGLLLPVALIGLLELGADIALIYATVLGQLSVVSVLASLSALVTAVLVRFCWPNASPGSGWS